LTYQHRHFAFIENKYLDFLLPGKDSLGSKGHLENMPSLLQLSRAIIQEEQVAAYLK
jgi:hypothetical protein